MELKGKNAIVTGAREGSDAESHSNSRKRAPTSRSLTSAIRAIRRSPITFPGIRTFCWPPKR